jgi:hypothetical protein
MKRTCTILCVVFLSATIAAGDGDVHPIRLILHPAASSIPALKYPLLPELRDTIPGNAAKHYHQAVKNMMKDMRPENDWFYDIREWQTMPLKELPRPVVNDFLKTCETTFPEVEAGARSEQCDWGLTKELCKKGPADLSLDVRGTHAIVMFLAVRARFEMAEGRPEKAARTLQTGFAVAHHVAENPTLLSAPDAIDCASLMVTQLEEFIQQPNAPNLYWSLTDLPRPFIDLRKAMQGERVGVYGMFPGMAEAAADLNAKPFTPEQVEKALQNLGDQDNDLLRGTDKARLALDLAPHHEAAKKILIDQGRPKELVDAMPPFQVGLLVGLRRYDQILDEYMKLETLPYNEGRGRMEDAEKRIHEQFKHDDGSVIPWPYYFLSGTPWTFACRVQIDRRVAALRCVEAVRLYAGDHDGKLPISLEDIKDAPLPLDPVTGKAFDYKLVGDRAFLTCAPFPCTPFPDQKPNNANTPTYELMMKK